MISADQSPHSETDVQERVAFGQIFYKSRWYESGN